ALIVAAVLAILFVRRITRLQDDNFGAVPAWSPEGPSAGDGPPAEVHPGQPPGLVSGTSGPGFGVSRRSRPAPSRSTFGIRGATEGGSNQGREPSIATTAGMIVIRTTKASKRMPTARAKPIDLMIGSSGMMKPAKTEIMIRPAAVTTRAPWRKPVR